MSTLEPEDNQSVECPECGEYFEGEGGMRTHYGWMHEGSLARSTYNCDWCGDEYEQWDYRHEKKGHEFCSMECRDAWRSETFVGKNHPNHVERLELECSNCGAELNRLESQIKGNQQFCDKDCLGEWRSENICGENHPRYNPDKIELDYGERWHKQRERAIQRDGGCRICGMSREKHNEVYENDITVHHIRKLREFEGEDGEIDHDAANDLSNLLTLCYSCHSTWEDLPIQPEIV